MRHKGPKFFVTVVAVDDSVNLSGGILLKNQARGAA